MNQTEKIRFAFRIIMYCGIAIHLLFISFQLISDSLIDNICILKHLLSFSLCFIITPLIARMVRVKYKRKFLFTIYGSGWFIVLLIYAATDCLSHQLWSSIKSDIPLLPGLYSIIIIAYSLSLSLTLLGHED